MDGLPWQVSADHLALLCTSSHQYNTVTDFPSSVFYLPFLLNLACSRRIDFPEFCLTNFSFEYTPQPFERIL